MQAAMTPIKAPWTFARKVFAKTHRSPPARAAMAIAPNHVPSATIRIVL